MTEQAQEELQGVSEDVSRASSSSLRRLKSVLKVKERRRQKPATKEKAETASEMRQNRRTVSAKSMSQSGQAMAARRADNARRTHARLQSATAHTKERTRKTAASIVKSLLRKITRGGSGLYAASAVVVVVLMSGICLAGSLFGSSFGIFFSNQTDGSEYMNMSDVVSEISSEYYAKIGDLQASHPHDAVEIVSDDGTAAIRWPQVLSVYAALLTKQDGEGVDVVTMTEEKKERLKTVFGDMNELTASTYPRMREVEKTVTDEYGEQQTVTETVIETVLQIHVKRTPPEEMADQCGFDDAQREQLSLLLDEQYADFWVNLLGTNASGGFIDAGTEWLPTGSYSWPLPQGGRITSGFGYRSDPISGETKLHGGVDIAADTGTPIRAACAGTVLVADTSDPYGGYGYYVMLDHGNGQRTLYGHCSALCVSQGQVVAEGEIIALVGSTGYSTGPHLHFEVYTQGQRVDPLSFFAAG